MAYTTSLISHWKLGTALDSHGTNHLTEHNAPSYVAAKLGNGVDFESTSSQYLSCTSNSSLQAGDIDFTFSFWFNLETAATGFIIVGKDTDSPASSRDYTIDIDDVGPKLRFFVNGGAAILTHSETITAGTYYFGVCWHNAAADTLNVQLNNGTVETVSTGGIAPNTSSAEFRIGARQYSGFEGYFDGIVNSVSFWKRTLDTTERSGLWNSGNGLDYDSFGAAAGPVIPVFMNQYRQRCA